MPGEAQVAMPCEGLCLPAGVHLLHVRQPMHTTSAGHSLLPGWLRRRTGQDLAPPTTLGSHDHLDSKRKEVQKEESQAWATERGWGAKMGEQDRQRGTEGGRGWGWPTGSPGQEEQIAVRTNQRTLIASPTSKWRRAHVQNKRAAEQRAKARRRARQRLRETSQRRQQQHARQVPRS